MTLPAKFMMGMYTDVICNWMMQLREIRYGKKVDKKVDEKVDTQINVQHKMTIISSSFSSSFSGMRLLLPGIWVAGWVCAL